MRVFNESFFNGVDEESINYILVLNEKSLLSIGMSN